MSDDPRPENVFEYNGAHRAHVGSILAAVAANEAMPLVTTEVTTPSTQNIQQFAHHKVKVKKPLQRACNEKDEKGKHCGGHLKRWFYATDAVERECGDVEKAWGANAEVYRCENCKTLYLPNPEDAKVNVAGQGQKSVFGLTLPPKGK